MQQVNEPERSKEHLIMMPASKLKLGMYIAELDRPWLETSFLLEGILLDDEDDLKALQRQCRSVFVDFDRSTPTAQAFIQRPKTASRPSTPAAPPPASKPSSPPVIGKRAYGILRPVEQELQRARVHYGEARGMVLRLMHDEQSWHRNIPEIKRSVGGFAESILTNPSALNWLTLIKEESEYTAEHCLNVGVLAMIFGRHLGFEQQHIEELGLAGMLHDVGKMKIDPLVLDKPGKLTDEEFAQIKAHTLEGYAMLADDPDLPTAVKEASRDHHERMNGSGYPYGKKGDEIGLYAKIIAIVDTYDAITSDRVYSKARPASEALRILYETRRTHYDEALIFRFIDCIGLYPPGSIVEFKNGMVGAVLSVNPTQRLNPRVLVMLNRKKAPIPHVIVDLADLEASAMVGYGIQQVLPPGSYGIRMEDMLDQLMQAGAATA